MPYLLRGIVKENYSEDYPGMVRVELLYGEAGYMETLWVPVMSPYAGAGYGMYLMPETGTQVLVAFMEGSFDLPVIIGALKDEGEAHPEGCAGEENEKKCIRTKSGHELAMIEDATLRLVSAGGQEVLLDDEAESVTIKSGSTELMVDGGNNEILMKAGKIRIESDGDIAVEAGAFTLKSDGRVSLKGASLQAEATGVVEVKGSMIKLN